MIPSCLEGNPKNNGKIEKKTVHMNVKATINVNISDEMFFFSQNFKRMTSCSYQSVHVSHILFINVIF